MAHVINSGKKFKNVICCVPQCKNYAGAAISMHTFPQDQKKKREWIQVLRIGKDVSEYMKVCNKHFKKSDYILPDQPTKRPRLKKGAVPTQNIPVGSVEAKKPHNSPAKRARNDRVVNREASRQHSQVLPHSSPPSPPHFVDDEEAAQALLELRFALMSTQEKDADIDIPLQEMAQLNLVDTGVQVTPSLLDSQKFTLYSLLKTDKHFRAFSGVSTRERFHNLLESLEQYEKLDRERKYGLICRDRLLLCLVKLKLNVSYVCLSAFFQVTATTCQRYFSDTIQKLSSILSHVIRFPSMAEIRNSMPLCFKNYPTVRAVLDCTEVPIERTKCLKCRILTYSHYKGKQTVKFMVAAAPSGLIVFVSPCYGGRASDKSIFLKSNFLSKLDRNDSLLIDKGFLIENDCIEKGVKIIRPPFLKDKQQMTAEDAYKTASIAAARVHIERCMQRLKVFGIFTSVMSYDILPYCNQIATTIVGLTNLSNPILNKKRFME